MNAQARAVLAHVDARELIDLASALIRIPSFKTEETPVALFLEEFFRARGYASTSRRSSPGACRPSPRSRGTGGGASLMLNGHTDINALTLRVAAAIRGRRASRATGSTATASRT